jgi:hypothetical protein
MRRFLTLTLACLAVTGLAACGDDEETTTTATEVETTTEADTTTPTATTATEPTSTTSTTTSGSQDCGEGEVYSSSIGECIAEREGNNPCPNGEVPMADEPVCVPKDD